MKKISWEKPQIVVLLKGEPREGVLDYCFIGEGSNVGPEWDYSGCRSRVDMFCGWCWSPVIWP